MRLVLPIFVCIFAFYSLQISAQCPNNNILAGDLTPLTTGNTQQANCAHAGEYFTVQVCSGTSYTFSTCGDNDFDTQLTLYTPGGVTALAFNDDGGCGLQSQIIWTSTFTGTVWILLDQYFCESISTACMTLRVTQNTACTDFPPCNGLCPPGGTPPVEDDCFTAINLGQMPFPAVCVGTSGGLGTPVTFNLTNVCASPATPYNFMSNCADGTDMAAPALDVWYQVTLTASQLIVTLEAGMDVPSLGLWRDVGLGCGGLQPAGCTTGSAGYATETFGPLLPGVYYLQISGGDLGDQCDFLLTLQNNNSCADCLVGQSLTVDPLPVDGVYAPGTLVTFCYTVNDYNDAAAINWLHGIVPVFGPGWDMSTLLPQAPPTDCGTGQGFGVWSWYNFPITGQNGSSAQTTSIGPGFFHESNFGCPGACNPANPGDNWGDNLGIFGCVLTFCWRIATMPAGAACVDEASLNVYVETYSDSETGSWTLPGCVNDPDIDFFATLNCCDVNGTVTNNGPLCIGQTLQLGVNVTTPGTTITYEWSGPDGFTATTAAPTLPNIQLNNAGYYSVIVTVDGCISIPLFTLVQLHLQADMTAGNSGAVCPGGNITLSASSTAVNITGYQWTGPNGFSSNQQNPVLNSVGAAQAGTYTVIATDANGCSSAAATTDITLLPVPNLTAGNTGPVCSGSNISLTASTTSPGVATYTWSGPNSFTSNVQNPAINGITIAEAGVYTVTISIAGCNNTASTTVTINPAPNITASNNGPACLGGSVDLSASTTTPGTATYSWSGPNGFTSTQQNPVVTPITAASAGTYSVTVTVNGCSSAPATTTVAIGSPPNATATNDGPDCAGNDITLSASTTTPGVATYQWSGPNGFTSTAQNPVLSGITAAMAGDYTVTITIGGCSSAPATTTVVINPAPNATASNNGPVCPGGNVNLTASTTTPGIATYQWTGPNGFTSTTANPTINGISAAQLGTYTVIITVNGCASLPATTDIVQQSPPLATASNNGPACLGGSITLNGSTTTPGAATYNWSGPNGFSSTQQNPVINPATAAVAGVYSVTVTIGGCASLPATTNVVVNTLPTATAGNNGPVCAGAALNLTGSTSTSGTTITYAWSGPNSFSSTQQNPVINPASAANAGTYTLIVTVDGCASNPVTTDVVITPSPNLTAGNNGPACIGQPITLSATTTTPGTATYNWSGPNGFTSTQQNPMLAGVTATTAGAYSVTVTINGCSSLPATTNVVVTPQPNATATNSGACSGGMLTLNGATTTPGTSIGYSWTGPNGFTSAVQNPVINPVTAANAGVYTLIITVDGCPSLAVTTTVIVNNGPVATVALTATICNTIAAGSSLDFNSLITGGDFGGIWTDVSGSGASGTLPFLNFNGAVPGNYTFSYTTNSAIPPCTETTYFTTVVVEDCTCPSVAIAVPSPLCNDSGILDLLTLQITAEPGTWAVTGTPPGVSPAAITGNILDAVNADPGTYQITFTLNTPPPAGCPAFSTQNLIVSDAVFAGSNNLINVCNNDPAPLDLNTLLIGADSGGTWQLAGFSPVPNPGSFNAATGVLFLTGQTAGTYTFNYTLTTSAPCTNSIASIAVVVSNQPVANVMTPPLVCNTASGGSTLNLNTLLPVGTSAGVWTDNLGVTVSNPNLNFDGFAPGGYAYTYTTTTAVAPCTNISSNITVTVEDCACPSVALNPPPALCNSTGSLDLTTIQVTTQPGSWTITSIPPGATNPASITGTVFNAAGATPGTYQITFTLSTVPAAGCPPSSTQNIFVAAAPNSGTGGTTTVCNTQLTPVVLSDLLTGASGGGAWSLTSGTAQPGSFNAATGQFNPNGHTPVTLTFTYTLTGNPPCANATTSVTVTVGNAPNAGTSGTLDVCNTQTTPIILTDILTGEDTGGTWTLSSGVAAPGSFNAAAGTFNPDSHPLTTLVFTYTVPAAGACAAATSTATVNVFDAPSTGTAANLQVCNNQPALINLFAQLTGEDTGGNWTITGGTPDAGAFDPASGSFAPNNHTPGLYSFTYSIAASGLCPASSSEVQVEVFAQPSATVTPNANVCNLSADGSILNLDALVTAGNTTGNWVETSGSGVSLANTSAVDFNGIGAGTYTFTYNLPATAPCTNPAYLVSVLVQDCSCPSVAFNQPPDICNDLGTIDLSTLLITTQPGTWSITSVPAGSTNPAFLVGSTFAGFGADAGAYTITYTLTTAPPAGCLPSASANLLVVNAVSAGTATDLQVCNNSTTIIDLNSLLTGESTGGVWSVVSGLPDAGSFNAAAATFNPDGHTAGDLTFAYTVTAAAPCADDVETVTVSISDAVSAGVGGSLGLCNNTPTILDLFGLLGGASTGGTWANTSGVADAGAFDPIAGTFDPNGHSAGIFTFTYTVSGAAPCVDDSEDIVITINTALNAGTDISIDVCNDAGSAVNLFTQLTGADLGGTWSLAVGSPNTPGGTSFNAIAGTFNPAGQTAGAYIFTYTQPAVGDCNAVSADVTVNVSTSVSSTLVAGDDICNASADGSVLNFSNFILSGNTTGTWTDTDGSGVNLTDPTSVDFNGVAPSTYTFTYTIGGSGGCLPVSYTVEIVVEDCACPSVATTPPTALCNSAAILNLSTLQITTQPGTWSITTIPAGATNPATLTGTNFDATGSTPGTYTVNFTLDTPPPAGCPTSSSQNIVVNAAVIVGSDNSLDVCNDTAAPVDLNSLLAGANPGGVWSVLSGSPNVGTVNLAAGTFNTNGHPAGTFQFQYTITGTGTGFCATDAATITVNISAAQQAVITSTANICNLSADGSILDFTSLITSGITTGTWSDTGGSGVNLTNLAAVDFNGIASGDYVFTYTLNATAPCSDFTGTVTITVEDCSCPSVATLAPADLCNDNATLDLSTLQVTTEAGTWSLTGLPVGSNPATLTGTIFNATGFDAGDYELTFTLNTAPPVGCPSTSVETLTVQDAPEAGSGGAQTVCNSTGNDVNLADLLTGADLAGTWAVQSGSPQGGSFNAVAGTFNPDSQTPGIYEFSYTVNGTAPCVNSIATVTITVEDCNCITPPTPSIVAGDINICAGDINSTAFEVTTAPNTIVNWYDAAVGGNLLGTGLTFTPTTAGQYFAEAVNNPDDGCQSVRIEFLLIENPVPVAAYLAPANACLGLDNSITFNGTAGPSAIYEWDFGSAGTQTGSGPLSVVWNVPGNESISLVVTENGCTHQVSTSVYVSGVTATATADPLTALAGTTINLTATGTNSGGEDLTYSWSSNSGTLSCTDCPNPTTNMESNTTYTVTITNEFGCFGIASVNTVLLLPPEIENAVLIPNAFSPNEDAVNDIFRLAGINVEEFELRVYNRFGEEVFFITSTNLSEGWDGTFRGKQQEIGTYAYKALVRFMDGEEKIMKGNVTLIR